MPEAVKDRCVKSHEYIFLFSLKPHYYFDYEAIQEKAKYAGDNVGIEHLYGLYYARDDLDVNDNDGVVEISVLMQEKSKKWLSEH